MQATFTLSANAVVIVAPAGYSNIPQQNGKTYNDFTDTVKYYVRSQNGKIQTFSVLVSFGAKPAAAITAAGSLNAFSTVTGAPSSVQNFTVSGTNLSAAIAVKAPANFEVSTNSTSGFGSSVSLSPSSGTVSNTYIYVRFNPASSGNYNGNVTCSSAGASTQNVAVSGTATIPTAVITTSASMSSFSAVVGPLHQLKILQFPALI